MSKRILVADDKASSRELIRTVLERSGYEIVEASDGLEALAGINEHKPDLVLLDLQMPNLDGFGVVRKLRESPASQSLPVIALTANAMQGDRERVLAAGFTGYIAKPVSLSALRKEIEGLLV